MIKVEVFSNVYIYIQCVEKTTEKSCRIICKVEKWKNSKYQKEGEGIQELECTVVPNSIKSKPQNNE